VNPKIATFLAQRRPETPCLVVDLDTVAANYRALARTLPHSAIYYAVKANPAPPILALLAELGSSFDTASVAEIEQVLAAGVTADRISYGNTIKKQRDIAAAYGLGVRLFAIDSRPELHKVALAAPGAGVFCRVATSGAGAEWPLSNKFGCDPGTACDLLIQAAAAGLQPRGISFHVGSQQCNPEAWDAALATTASLFHELAQRGIALDLVNLGGGFPAQYRSAVPEFEAYGEAIRRSLRRHFGGWPLTTIIEPGRGLIGNAGVIQSEVVLIATKTAAPGTVAEPRRWVYLDIGKFGGLAETIDEAIRYPVTCDRTGREDHVILAGPTCDSVDVLYERSEYRLPVDLKIGDRVLIHAAGAYTTSYASTGFNGFKPPDEYYI
jgi:ornithine decarboxylase